MALDLDTDLEPCTICQEPLTGYPLTCASCEEPIHFTCADRCMDCWEPFCPSHLIGDFCEGCGA